MRTLVIGICSGSAEVRALLEQHLKIAETAFGMTFQVIIYKTGPELLHPYFPIHDLLFIDLPVANMDCERLLHMILQRSPRAQIILTGKNLEAYRIGFHYKVRNVFAPVLRYRYVYHELEKLLSEETAVERPYIWCSTNWEHYKIYLHQLRYIETAERQLCFRYGTQEHYFNGKMATYTKLLPADQFFRCNNSYLVNMDYIISIERDLNRYKITLTTGETLPLSRNAKKELLIKLQEKMY